ncbi:MAG: acetate--CoA ligase family protein [SAR324 cluster bacterium]|nr:acetate--CoA ligase family protein [SAR324 cluster bacterium]
MKNNRIIDALFRPKTVALVGASSDEKKTSSRAQRYLLKHGFQGDIFPVNPNRKDILGIPCFPTLSSIPVPIDQAFIMLPTAKVIAAVEECVNLAIPCVNILTGGFAEAGEKGIALQTRLARVCQETGVRILGPNSIGLINPVDRVALSVNAMLDLPTLIPGNVGVVSQSGSLIGALLSHVQAREAGYSKLVSVGNEVDLGVSEITDFLIDDAATKVILLFLETLRSPQSLKATALRAFRAGKPIIAFKLGRSSVGQDLASSHTGSIAGADEIFSQFLSENGIIRVNLFETLFELPPLMIGKKPMSGKQVSIVTTTGGGGAMVADILGTQGIELAAVPVEIVQFLQTKKIEVSGSLIDLTLAGTKAEIVQKVIGILLDSPEIQAVIMVVGSSGQFHPKLAVEPILRWAGSDKPLAVYVVPNAPFSLAMLTQAGIAAFRTPESCAEAIRALLQWKEPHSDWQGTIAPSQETENLIRQFNKSTLLEREAGRVFKSLGISIPVSGLAHSAKEAVEIGDALGYPLVAKVLSEKILHKTEAGAVVLNIKNAEELKSAYDQIICSVSKFLTEMEQEGILIQKMETSLQEVLLGYKIDPVIGPTVVLGTGGVLTEIYQDIAIRIPPLSLKQAFEMIEEVKGLAVIRGFRSLPRGDCDALAKAIVNFSRLADLKQFRVFEAEINPILVKAEGEGVLAVDGMLVLENT